MICCIGCHCLNSTAELWHHLFPFTVCKKWFPFISIKLHKETGDLEISQSFTDTYLLKTEFITSITRIPKREWRFWVICYKWLNSGGGRREREKKGGIKTHTIHTLQWNQKAFWDIWRWCWFRTTVFAIAIPEGNRSAVLPVLVWELECSDCLDVGQTPTVPVLSDCHILSYCPLFTIKLD